MSDENFKIITINREYGAGGRTFAKALSEKTNLPWYDNDFVTETARDSGYSTEAIKTEGEELCKSTVFWDSVMNGSVCYSSSHDKIYEAQKEEILKLAEKPCIIVGRCSNIILKQNGIKTFDIYLYADMEYKVNRIKELAETEELSKKIPDIQKYIEKREEMRRLYYKHYTNHILGDSSDYSICLKTSDIDIENAAGWIARLLKNQ